MNSIELGMGLLAIGRHWGVKNNIPPDEESSVLLIKQAYLHGLRFFDTAPAYARSESILGNALFSKIVPRNEVIVSTKMGEYWSKSLNAPYANHTYNHLVSGIENSIKILGKIDLLQLHKANIKNITSPDVIKAIDFAKNIGIKTFGASVSDLETAAIACESGIYQYIQFPFNAKNRNLEPIFHLIKKSNIKAIINRPFAMGKLVEDINSTDELFSGILAMDFCGIILTGTSSSAHLTRNIESFNRSHFNRAAHAAPAGQSSQYFQRTLARPPS